MRSVDYQILRRSIPSGSLAIKDTEFAASGIPMQLAYIDRILKIRIEIKGDGYDNLDVEFC